MAYKSFILVHGEDDDSYGREMFVKVFGCFNAVLYRHFQVHEDHIWRVNIVRYFLDQVFTVFSFKYKFYISVLAKRKNYSFSENLVIVGNGHFYYIHNLTAG